MELQNRIGIRVQALRKAKGLTQEELAGRSGKSVDTLSLIERGRILPAIDTLYALGHGLDVSAHQLLPDDDGAGNVPAEVARLREAAWASLCQMEAKTLSIAVEQIKALAPFSE